MMLSMIFESEPWEMDIFCSSRAESKFWKILLTASSILSCGRPVEPDTNWTPKLTNILANALLNMVTRRFSISINECAMIQILYQ